MSYSKNKNGNKYRFSVSSDSESGRRKSFKVSATPTREQWAEQVVQHFLNVNVFLSGANAVNEWSNWAKEDSKRWSNDGNTITPWRFIGIETDNMIPVNDRVSCEYWSDDDASVKVNAQGYYKPDVAGENGQARIDNPRRMWGNNCPYIDKLINRLLGREKYTEYEPEKSEYTYDYDEYEYNPATGATEIKSAEEVANYYWDTFGYEGGLGNNTSSWLYPFWAEGQRLNRSPSDLYASDNHMYGGTLLRAKKLSIDKEGKELDFWDDSYNIPTEIVSHNAIRGYKVSNIDDEIGLISATILRTHSSKIKSDRLTIISSTETNIFFNLRNGTTGSIGYAKIPNFLLCTFYNKSYTRLFAREYRDNYPLPSLRGTFSFGINALDNNALYSVSFFKSLEAVPLSRLNIYFFYPSYLTNLSKITDREGNVTSSFKNITTRFGADPRDSIVRYRQRGSLAVYMDKLELKNCPNLEVITGVVTDGINLQNCPKLDDIVVYGRQSLTATTPFDIEIDANGVAQNLNIPYVKELHLSNCLLTSVQVDAVIKAFRIAVIDNGEYGTGDDTYQGLLVLDRRNSYSSTEPIKNAPPSEDNLTLDNNIVPNSDLDVLSQKWTVLYNNN